MIQKSTLPAQSFYFLRHGETDWNKSGIYMGSQDIPLNAHGVMQSSAVYESLQDANISHIVSSPLQRALQSAQIVNAKMNKSLTIVDELKECCFGVTEGQPYNDSLIQKWQDGDRIAGAEPYSVFQERIIRGFSKIWENGPRPLVVSHGFVYECLAKCMGWKMLDLPNAHWVFHP